jgi:hypothetical protein
MAEIKSAIELAMEKTKGLVMDDREKRSLALRELAAGMMTIYRRYREGLTGDDETRAQLDAPRMRQRPEAKDGPRHPYR